MQVKQADTLIMQVKQADTIIMQVKQADTLIIVMQAVEQVDILLCKAGRHTNYARHASRAGRHTIMLGKQIH